MATKKTAAKKAAPPDGSPGTIASLPESLVIGGVLSIPEGSKVDFRFRYSTPGSLIALIAPASELTTAAKSLIDQVVPPPDDVVVRVLPPLAAGRYVMNWSFLPTDEDFETAAEFWINGILSFRHVKTSQSNIPFPKGHMFLEVF